MRSLAIFCLLILTAASCQKRSDKALRQRQAARFLMQKGSEDTLLFRLSQIYDPYNGGQYRQPDSANPSFLQLHSNGTFTEYDSLNQYAGLWFVNKTHDRMKLMYQVQNQQEVLPEYQDTIFRYQLLILNEDTLSLGLQGRHGIVQRTYLPVRDTISLMPDSMQQDSLKPDTSSVRQEEKERLVAANPMAPNQPTLSREAANEIVFDSLSQDTCSWRLYSIRDPYQMSLPKYERADPTTVYSENPSFLRFVRNGDFIRFDRNAYEHGQWFLSQSDDHRMKFVSTFQNGAEVPPAQRDEYYRYQLQKRTADTLRIGIQGRHGMVRYTYLYCPNDSVPKIPR